MNKFEGSEQGGISRRDFIKMSAVGAGSLAFRPWERWFDQQDFPDADKLGRVCVGRVDLKARPDYDAPNVSVLYEDAVVPWLREVVGYWPSRHNQRWVETPEGYIWSPEVQPVQETINQPVAELPVEGEKPGMWVQVTVPWVAAELENAQPYSSWWKLLKQKNLSPRFYYQQIFWVDQIHEDEQGQTWYRINERYGNPGDLLWARAEAFRPLTREELEPINPEVEDKHIVVDRGYSQQTLSCFENEREVYFCRISTGRGENSTPLSGYGTPGFPIWRKVYSLQMSGGTNQQGWMIPGIGWTTLFKDQGIAIHSTFWHNNFGEPSSHGCVNAKPEDAKWISRWTQPQIPYPEGDITISGSGSTRIKVIEY